MAMMRMRMKHMVAGMGYVALALGIGETEFL